MMHNGKKSNEKIDLQKGALFTSYSAVIIAFLALLIDGIHYYEINNNFQMWLNILMLPIIITAGVLLIWRRDWYKQIMIAALLPLLINILLTMIDDGINRPENTFIIMRNVYTATVISFLTTYVIKRTLIYFICISISAVYIVTAFLTGSQELIENIFAVIFVQFAIVFVLDNFIKMYSVLEKQAKDSERKVIQLSQNVEIERKEFIEKLDSIKLKCNSTDQSIINEIDILHHKMSSGVTNMIFDYAEKKSKDDQLFFNLLLKSHPKLTHSDLRLCFLLSNNMTTKEIAIKTSRTADSVRVLRSRLRKKLSLDRDQSLYLYLKDFVMLLPEESVEIPIEQ